MTLSLYTITLWRESQARVKKRATSFEVARSLIQIKTRDYSGRLSYAFLISWRKPCFAVTASV